MALVARETVHHLRPSMRTHQGGGQQRKKQRGEKRKKKKKKKRASHLPGSLITG